jgi:hypothetical protein
VGELVHRGRPDEVVKFLAAQYWHDVPK